VYFYNLPVCALAEVEEAKSHGGVKILSYPPVDDCQFEVRF